MTIIGISSVRKNLELHDDTAVRANQKVALELQRKAIDNSTFRNQSDIGQAVQDWTENYNATHERRINDILQIGAMHMLT